LQDQAHETKECDQVGGKPHGIKIDYGVPEWLHDIFGQWRSVDTAIFVLIQACHLILCQIFD